MDKNMINIDDLLRQRLGDAEEQERPGAWMNMRDVLDKQMPVGKVPAAAVNWRRMFAYVAGLALLAAISVGGYQMSHSFNTQGDMADNNIAPAQEDYASATTGLAGTAINALPDTKVEAEIAAQPAPATDAANTTITTQSTAPASTAATTQPSTAASNTYASSTSNKKLNNSKLNNVSESNISSNNNQQPTQNSNNNSNTNTSDIAAASSNTSSTDMNSNTPQPAAKKAAKEPATPNKTAGNVANNNATNNSKQKTTPAQPLTNNKQATEVAMNNTNVKEVPETKFEIEEKVGRDGKPFLDTVNKEEGVRKIRQAEKEQLALNKKKDDNTTASGSEIMPSSAAKAAKESGSEEGNMEKLGDHKVKSKKMKNYNPHRFEEMVQNAKYRMGSVKFYPGIVGGANMSLNGNTGFQVGLALNTKVSDRWSILTEVKYAYRWNGGSNKVKMQDDYIDNVKPTVINGQGVYTYDSMEHFFNFNNYGVLSVPVMLSYKTDNGLSFMAGVDINYNFKINSLQEVEQIYASEKPRTSTSNPVFSTEKTILLSDFAPTFNMGPVLGVGYQLNPAWKVDFRISKPVWNNASTFGQKEIAKELYSKPQGQLNFTWKIPSVKPQYKRNR